MSTSSDPPLHVPKPRRPFDLDMTSSSSGATTPNTYSQPSTLSRNNLPAWLDQSTDNNPTSPTSPNGAATPSTLASNDFTKRTKSVLNLTASTLFGIYSTPYLEGTEPPTPALLSRTSSMVNVAETMPAGLAAINGPANTNGNSSGVSKTLLSSEKGSAEVRRRRGPKTSVLSLTIRLLALLGFGIGYGVIVMHLHNTRTFTPAWWEDLEGYNAGYLLVWGLVGVALGSLLPWIDVFLGEDELRSQGDGGTDWIQVVRSVGAFVGIAYAIRKLPWQSTTQISLTLALVNPFLWYIVDRTRAGFALASAVGVAGTLVLIQINPHYIQAPAQMPHQIHSTQPSEPYPSSSAHASAGAASGAGVSYDTLAVGAWMASVLFCSCVCFGNIGRKLALRERDL